MPVSWLLHNAKSGDSEAQYSLWLICLFNSEFFQGKEYEMTYENYREKRERAGKWAKYWKKEFDRNKNKKEKKCHIIDLFKVYEHDFNSNNEDESQNNSIVKKYRGIVENTKYSEETIGDALIRISARANHNQKKLKFPG